MRLQHGRGGLLAREQKAFGQSLVWRFEGGITPNDLQNKIGDIHSNNRYQPILQGIHEHPHEDTIGIYSSADQCRSRSVLCLEELITHGSDNSPPSGPVSVQVERSVGQDLWINLDVSEYYAQKETIMWDNIANYVEQGNKYIVLLNDRQWFRGWQGLPEGCTLKPMTAAAFNDCVTIEDNQVKQIFIYLDGSSNTNDSEPVMSWGFCCFRIDDEFNHELVFSFGGIMCSDVDSPLYSGAEKRNSFTAELQGNVMARLWLLQSGVEEHIKIVFCMTINLLLMPSLANLCLGRIA